MTAEWKGPTLVCLAVVLGRGGGEGEVPISRRRSL